MGQCSKIGKIVVFIMSGLLLAANVQASSVARVITYGKIDVYRNGVLSQVLREDAPLPTGAVLKPEGNCGIRLENILLVAKDGSEFGVHSAGNPVQLALKKGMIHFAVNRSTGQMIFETPAGDVTTRQFYIHAAAEGTLKGFVEVNEGTTTIGVLEGGAMVVSTPGGEETITAGNQIILAQAGLASQGAGKVGAVPAAKPANEKSKITKNTIVSASLLTAYAVAGTWWLVDELGDDDSDPAAASPSTP
jgi:hypothetical protein